MRQFVGSFTEYTVSYKCERFECRVMERMQNPGLFVQEIECHQILRLNDASTGAFSESSDFVSRSCERLLGGGL